MRDYEKQQEDQRKKEYLQQITDMLERRNLIIKEYDNKIKANETAQSFLDPADFGGKNIALNDKYELTSNKLADLKNQFEELNNITPKSSDQAQKLASQMETVASSIMEAEQSMFAMEQEMQSLGLEAFSKNLENINNQYERETSLLNNMSSLLENDNGIVDAWDLVNLNAYGSIERDDITDNRSKYKDMIDTQDEYQQKSLAMNRLYLDLLKEEQDKENETFWTDMADNLQDAKADMDEAYASFFETHKNTIESMGFVMDEFLKKSESAFRDYRNEINATMALAGNPVNYRVKKDGTAPEQAKIGDFVETDKGEVYEIVAEGTEGATYNEKSGRWSKKVKASDTATGYLYTIKNDVLSALNNNQNYAIGDRLKQEADGKTYEVVSKKRDSNGGYSFILVNEADDADVIQSGRISKDKKKWTL